MAEVYLTFYFRTLRHIGTTRDTTSPLLLQVNPTNIIRHMMKQSQHRPIKGCLKIHTASHQHSGHDFGLCYWCISCKAWSTTQNSQQSNHVCTLIRQLFKLNYTNRDIALEVQRYSFKNIRCQLLTSALELRAQIKQHWSHFSSPMDYPSIQK